MTSSQIRRRPAVPPCGFGADVHPVLRRVYAARGLKDSEDLDLSLDRLLPVSSLAGVDAAAELLAAHRAAGRVLVIGDFDADGATSTALVVRALRAMRFAHVDFLVPNRFRFGYGLTPEIVALGGGPPALADRHRRQRRVERGRRGGGAQSGHSRAGDRSSPARRGAAARASHRQSQSRRLPASQARRWPAWGSRSMSSPRSRRALAQDGFRAAELLDLVALGTVADVVPLDRNNRILVAQGLRRIRAGRCVPGIRALLESAGRDSERITAADLGFAVAPRLNAAGRLTDMTVGIACLLADDADRGGAARGYACQAQRGAPRNRTAHAARGARHRRAARVSIELGERIARAVPVR